MMATKAARGAAKAWILADVGGTWVRFAQWRPDTGTGVVTRWRADGFASLADALEAFQRSLPARVPRAAIAIATPLRERRIRMTNRYWTFDARDLHATAGLETLLLINDFAAAAAGLPTLAETEADWVRATGESAGHWLLIGPGTGLGAAALFGVGSGREQVLASEAGHMGFAASEAALDGLRDLALTFWPRVSWERVLCGDGLSLAHAWQDGLARGRLPEPDRHASDPGANRHRADDRGEDGRSARAALLPAARVSALAAAGDPAARAAVRWFSRLLGTFAGDLCLAFGADGGIWLTGGVLDGIGDGFDTAAFLAAFGDKGRYAARQSAVPVRRVRVHDLAFRGLVRIVSGECDAPTMLVTAGQPPDGSGGRPAAPVR